MKISREKDKQIEVLLWSIALPGFGQFRNGNLVKGVFFIVLEFWINVEANLNAAIAHSFRGEIATAVATIRLDWLMFYPCIYLYAIWDAYTDAGETKSLAYLPFVLGAYIGTLGVIYSPAFRFAGNLLGPIWLPIVAMIIGSGVGISIQDFVLRRRKAK